MEIKCEIIRDLLPLYVEELTSKESSEAVSEHLKICAECRKEYEEMKSGETKTHQAQPEEIKPLKKIMQKLTGLQMQNFS